MSEFIIGRQYKLVDASKDAALKEVLDSGELCLPASGIVTCSSNDGNALYTHTAGVLWRGESSMAAPSINGWLVSQTDSLEAGAFELVEEKQS